MHYRLVEGVDLANRTKGASFSSLAGWFGSSRSVDISRLRIAEVTRGYEDPPTYTVRHNGQQVLMLGITMTDDGNIVDLGMVKTVGVSPDGVKSHQRFKKKFDLPFTLLADTGHAIAERYGVWKEKNLYGRRTWGVARTTFWIGPDLRIRKIYKKVDTAKHAEDILEDLRAARKK